MSALIVLIRESDGAPPSIELGGAKFRGRTEIQVQDGRVRVDGVLKGIFFGSFGIICRTGVMSECPQE
jgi:hypothetical protein